MDMDILSQQCSLEAYAKAAYNPAIEDVFTKESEDETCDLMHTKQALSAVCPIPYVVFEFFSSLCCYLFQFLAHPSLHSRLPRNI